MATLSAASLQGDFNGLDSQELVRNIHEFIAGEITGVSFKNKQITLQNMNAYPWSPQTLSLKGKFNGINTLDKLLNSKARITSLSLGSNYAIGREGWGYTNASGFNMKAATLFATEPILATAKVFNGKDQITGSRNTDTLYGHGGDDLIDGGLGGYDNYYGGAGFDSFAIRLHQATVTVWDFNPQEDTVLNYTGNSSLSVTHFTSGETTLWAGSEIVAWIKGGEYDLESLNIS